MRRAAHAAIEHAAMPVEVIDAVGEDSRHYPTTAWILCCSRMCSAASKTRRE